MKRNFSLNWVGLVKPSNYEIIKNENFNLSSFKIEPLEKGFGVTLANCLRRVLLSSLYGISISAVKFEGIEHEYINIDGIKEDVIDIIQNLKSIIFKGNVEFISEKFLLSINSKGIIRAKDIKINKNFIIINSENIICNVTKNININIYIIISSGKGYVLAKDHKINFKNFIPIDSLYSPILRCCYSIDNSRIGSKTEYDKLIFTIETNGSLTPEMSLSLSSKVLQNQLQTFVAFRELKETRKNKEKKLPFHPNLLRKVSDLELSVRSQNCLQNSNIIYVGDLVCKSEIQMLKTANFGKKSLNEIKNLLLKMDLEFGMNVKQWPISNIEQKAKIYLNDY